MTLAAHGLALLLADNQAVSPSYDTGFTDFGQGDWLGIPVPMWVLLVVLIFEFGLTVNALGRNAFRYFFCTMSVMLLGLVLMSVKGRKGGQWS